ncbi:MAG: RdgB/HAM1 family non-canonical purine NTP pyrophosphatase [Candidatus Omnitrophota bacterium]|nr:MAG: RdgB/HAM1 family non-canonical purine NTP pyrophosphatase [Candidatus Omnitrophota bacterium]
MRLIVATKNNSKFREIKQILKGTPFRVISLKQLRKAIRIREDGRSFCENALKKAKAVSKAYGDDLVVGEDSGIEVTHLRDKPGIFSKRYSGRNSTDLKNNAKLLRELEEVSFKHRTARFRCVLAVVRNNKCVRIIEGTLEGYISGTPKGKGGFGYDPVFYLPRYKKTVAQLTLRQKNKISHRAKAFRKLKVYLGQHRWK